MVPRLRKVSKAAIGGIRGACAAKGTKRIFLVYCLEGGMSDMYLMHALTSHPLSLAAVALDPAFKVESVRSLSSEFELGGIIIGDGPKLVRDDPPTLDRRLFFIGQVPVLGIGLGFKMIAEVTGARAEVVRKERRLGCHALELTASADEHSLLAGLPRRTKVMATRTEALAAHAPLYPLSTLACFTDDDSVAALGPLPGKGSDFYGLAFHPHVGSKAVIAKLLGNFARHQENMRAYRTAS